MEKEEISARFEQIYRNYCRWGGRELTSKEKMFFEIIHELLVGNALIPDVETLKELKNIRDTYDDWSGMGISLDEEKVFDAIKIMVSKSIAQGNPIIIGPDGKTYSMIA